MAPLILLAIAVAFLAAWRFLARARTAAPASPARAPVDSFSIPRVSPATDDPADEEGLDFLDAEPRPADAPAHLASLEALAAGLAHEINNPVAIMVEEAGWLEDLLDEEGVRNGVNLDEFRRALGVIRKQGQRCKDITSNLLSFARKAAGRTEETQLNDLVREVLRTAGRRAREAGIALGLQCDESLPVTWVSPSEMQQVLTNLVNNAIDAAALSSGRVDVATALDESDIVISIADTGPGIPRDQVDRIFDPFFTTKGPGRGTGLGLSICHGIVQRLGGRISVATEPGAGSTFAVRLPRRAVADADRVPSPQPAGVEPEMPDVLQPPRAPTVVLIVDDEVPFVEALTKRLKRRAVDVHQALVAEEALARLERAPEIDVVLLNVQMSAGAGLDLLRRIKERYPLVEVLLVSSHASVESAIEGMRRGAFDYVLKPCDMAQLVGQIRAARARKDRQEHRIVEARIKGIALRHP